MTYVVVTGSKRVEFDSLREALSDMTVSSRLYQMDAFGNYNPLTNDEIQELIQNEPIIHKKKATNQEQAGGGTSLSLKVATDRTPETTTTKKQASQKKETENKTLKYVLYLLFAAIIIFFLLFIIKPFFTEFMKTFNAFAP